MPRACTICTHVACAEIDATLSEGVSLDAVITQFDLPSRSALQRHRVSHLGRTVTLRVPAKTPPALSKSMPASEAYPSSDVTIDAELTRLFDRAGRSEAPSVQQVARLTIDGLLRIHAAASLNNDLPLSVKALRELRAMLALCVGTPVQKAQEGIGWVPPPEPRSPINALFEFILAGVLPSEERTETELRAAADLDMLSPGLGTDLLAEFAPKSYS